MAGLLRQKLPSPTFGQNICKYFENNLPRRFSGESLRRREDQRDNDIVLWNNNCDVTCTRLRGFHYFLYLLRVHLVTYQVNVDVILCMAVCPLFSWSVIKSFLSDQPRSRPKVLMAFFSFQHPTVKWQLGGSD